MDTKNSKNSETNSENPLGGKDTTPPSKEQVLNEPAGPRMDAWVAEFVLGWTRAHSAPKNPNELRSPVFTGNVDSGIIRVYGLKNGFGQRFHPSREWQGAGMVLDKMAEQGRFRNIYDYLKIKLWEEMGWENKFLAICQAALLVTLEEK